MKSTVALAEPVTVLRATITGNVISCLGTSAIALRNPVHTLCCLLADTSLADSAVSVSFGAGPELLIRSFREVAAWVPGRKWQRVGAADTAVAYMTRPDFPLVLELVEPLMRVRPSD